MSPNGPCVLIVFTFALCKKNTRRKNIILCYIFRPMLVHRSRFSEIVITLAHPKEPQFNCRPNPMVPLNDPDCNLIKGKFRCLLGIIEERARRGSRHSLWQGLYCTVPRPRGGFEFTPLVAPTSLLQSSLRISSFIFSAKKRNICAAVRPRALGR